MSTNLYCKCYSNEDKKELKSFNHCSYYTKSFFQEESDGYKLYYLDSPVIDMNWIEEKEPEQKQAYWAVNLSYSQLKYIVEKLEITLDNIHKASIKKIDSSLIDDFECIKNVINELKHILLYTKYELENTNCYYCFKIY